MSKVKSNIQDRMRELDAYLEWFDAEDFELEKAIEKFKKAQELAVSIEQDLLTLKNDITVISERFDKE